MANAVEDALNRASAEQRERNQQIIEEARHNIRLVSMRDEITPLEADSITKNEQAIEEAKRVIPFHTMKEVDSIGPPMNTPAPPRSHYNATAVEIHPETQSNIENIERGGGNNYRRDNAVDRAVARPSQSIQNEPQQKSLER